MLAQGFIDCVNSAQRPGDVVQGDTKIVLVFRLFQGMAVGGHAYVHVCHEWLMKVALGEVGRETGTGGGKKIERIEYFRALKCP